LKDVKFYIQQGFNHKNLYYEVCSKDSNNEESLGNLLELVRSYEGIDKPNIHFVIHSSLPQSIENYYPRNRKGGRDRKHATCTLLFI